MNVQNNGGAPGAASFYSVDVIELVELDANEVAAPISRLCEHLGMDSRSQIERVQDDPLLASGLSVLPVDTQYGVERQPCLRADLVPLWLIKISPDEIAEEFRPRLELFQRESASLLWQSFKPQGFSPEDVLVPPSREMTQAEQGYQMMTAMACLSRQQMMIERQIDLERSERGLGREQVVDPQARQMAQAVRVVANNLAMRSRRNEYNGVYQGLYRQFGISSYRNMPRGRYVEAMEWLDRWRGDIEGEPEPPPDI